MARINTAVKSALVTAEGAKAQIINPKLNLRRSVMACMLWEDNFYEEGESIADRIRELVHANKPEDVAEIAIEARGKMKLRHVPLLLVRELARHTKAASIKVSDVLAQVIQRADELCEFLAIYWKEKRQPLSGQVKKGLAKAFTKFSAYDLAKYNRNDAVKLKDVLFLSHAKPKDEEQAEVWKKLIAGTLETPDTWEVSLSGGKDKKETWERLITENKLGGLAFLRNLRNMREAGLSKSVISSGLEKMKVDRILPFRFITAAIHNPQIESSIEPVMMRCLSIQEKLLGKTVLILDVSGSMGKALSGKSEISRMDSAAALAILFREVCEEVSIYATAGNDHSMVHATSILPSRHGFALRDAFKVAESNLGGGGIFLKQVMDYTLNEEKCADRVIVFTDEQDCDRKCNPANANTYGKRNYLVNISSERNGIGYGKWTHIDGFSEAIIDYIIESEKVSNA